ncbi:MAG: hypothetical protein ABI345_03525 [Jatrophihabitans sp.]
MTQWNDPQGQQPRYDQPTVQYGQPGYGQPGYGQPAPGQPGMRYGAQNNPFGTEGNEEFGIVGMVLGLLGGVLLIVCFTALDWFSVSARGTSYDLTFSDISDGNPTGFATAYFGWFAWTFFVVAVVAAVASSFPSPALRALRVVGVVTAFAAAGLSFLAVQVTEGRGYVDWLKDARIGFYLAVIGFILVGIGAAIGPRKV